MGIQISSNQGTGHLRGKKDEILNQQHECIAFWHEECLGLGDSSLFEWSPWGLKWSRFKEARITKKKCLDLKFVFLLSKQTYN